MMENNEQLVHGMAPNTYCLIMNLINLFTGGGWIIAIIMWVVGKDKSEEVDKRGKDMTNWLISWTIYAIISGILCIIFVGFILLIILGIGSFVLPIIAAIKAINRDPWKYPLTIQFIK
ncbi:MAG: DUF4870 domain-containing protein [Bacteroides sp.]|nr:DUF4870 domain-containing protein [Bacteroides sp.]